MHAIKFQSVVAPNGLIANLYGPVEGRRHDSALLAMSGLLPQLEQHSFSPDGPALCIYGDPAYPHRLHLQCPFPRTQNPRPEEEAFNQSMSQVRISVEWIFGDIINYFKFIDFKKNLKIGMSISWTTSYLTSRRQYVQVDAKSSSILPTTFGVPQGSILGPMIFNLYVNDLQDHFSSSSVQYADDTTIYEACKPNDLENA